MLPLVIISLLLISFNNNISYGECKTSSSSTTNKPLAPALYVLGDSLVDSGNNNHLDTPAKLNYFPYGIDFTPPQATGRVTNGKTMADFLCDYLGLPYAPAYYAVPRPERWLTGYNYASSSCGILSETGIGRCATLEQQVSDFTKTIEEELAPNMSEEELKQHLSQSIFLIVIGSNDYLINYFGAMSSSRALHSPEEFAETLVTSLSLKLQELHKLGVRKAIVAELGALGCLPATRSGTGCDETKNEITKFFNQDLLLLMKLLPKAYPDSLFTHARIFDLTYDAFYNPTKYGLINSTDVCCRTVVGTGICWPTINGFPRPCQNRNEYFFWDGYHPTEAFYSIVAKGCINGSSTCLPYNVQQLVQLQNNPHVSLLSA